MPRCIEFDGDACIGCYACVIACTLAHRSPGEISRLSPGEPAGVSAIHIKRIRVEGEGEEAAYRYQPVACRHCDDAPCIDHCPESAIYRDEGSGITLIHKDDCTGCGVCLEVCPYEAPGFYGEKAVLCDLCRGRTADMHGTGGKRTACESVCPAEAIRVL